MAEQKIQPKPKKKRDERPKATPKNITPKAAAKERKGGVSNEAKAPRKRDNKAGTEQKVEGTKKFGRQIDMPQRKRNKKATNKNG
jgi:hypothetical protein